VLSDESESDSVASLEVSSAEELTDDESSEVLCSDDDNSEVAKVSVDDSLSSSFKGIELESFVCIVVIVVESGQEVNYVHEREYL